MEPAGSAPARAKTIVQAFEGPEMKRVCRRVSGGSLQFCLCKFDTRSEERRVGSDWSSDVCSSDLCTGPRENHSSGLRGPGNEKGMSARVRWFPSILLM